MDWNEQHVQILQPGVHFINIFLRPFTGHGAFDHGEAVAEEVIAKVSICVVRASKE